MSQRAVILSMKKLDEFPQMCMEIVKTAHLEGHNHVARRHLKMVARCPDLSEDLRQKLRLEEAQLFWSEGNVFMARYCICFYLCQIFQFCPLLQTLKCIMHN